MWLTAEDSRLKGRGDALFPYAVRLVPFAQSINHPAKGRKRHFGNKNVNVLNQY